jgi:ABC-2 type transport system permease protein
MSAELVLDRGLVPVPHRSPTWMTTTSLLARRNVLKTLRSPAFVSFSLLQPVVWLVLFSQTFSGLSDSPQFQRLGYPSYLTFVAPAMMVLSVLFTALQSGLSVVTDLDTGMLDKLRTDPIARSSILVGRLIADAGLMAAQATVVLVLAVSMGATVAGGWAGAATMTVGVVLFGVAWAALSDFVALHTADSELTMVIGLFLTLPVLFLTSAFFPRPELPGWLRAVSRANPAAYVIEAGRNVMNFGNDRAALARTGGILAATLVVTLAAATARTATSPAEPSDAEITIQGFAKAFSPSSLWTTSTSIGVPRRFALLPGCVSAGRGRRSEAAVHRWRGGLGFLAWGTPFRDHWLPGATPNRRRSDVVSRGPLPGRRWSGVCHLQGGERPCRADADAGEPDPLFGHSCVHRGGVRPV